MHLRKLLINLFLYFTVFANAQTEIVPNGGFEQDSIMKINLWNRQCYKYIAKYWTSANKVNFKPTNDTSQNLVEIISNSKSNKCAELFSRNEKFIAVTAIQIKLLKALQKGKTYLLRANLKEADSTCCGYYIKSCKFIFTDTSFFTNSKNHIKKPFVLLQDCNNEFINNWTYVFKKYKANGTEKYLTIELNSDVSQLSKKTCPKNKECENIMLSTDYYIDDISITESSDTAAIRCEEKKGSNYTKDAVIILPNITFMSNSDSLKPSSLAELKTLLVEMRQNAALEIEISGHTDDVGIAEKNIKLSDARAKAVKRYLVKNGISEKRIQTKGMGYNKPLIRATDKESRAKNRRVEVKVLKNI